MVMKTDKQHTAIHHPAVPMHEGDGVTVRRLFPVAGLRYHDPFVLWDDFTLSPDSGFPDHPHRGFEAITYLFSGAIEHRDNLGNHATVEAGGAQRFTAGSGLIHSEMPAREGVSRGIQLWINLPADHKGMAPSWQQADAADLPFRINEVGRITTIVGERSPITLQTAVGYHDLHFLHSGRMEVTLPDGHQAIVYVAQGDGAVDGQPVGLGESILLFSQKQHWATPVEISGSAGSRILYCHGKPHRQPVWQHGPYVD